VAVSLAITGGEAAADEADAAGAFPVSWPLEFRPHAGAVPMAKTNPNARTNPHESMRMSVCQTVL
jgi:hypothetical protein